MPNAQTNRQVLRYHKGSWEHIEDVISEERRLTVDWHDTPANDSGSVALWAWPCNLAPLALGHILLDVKPGNGLLSRACTVESLAEDHFRVTLGEEREKPSTSSLRNISGQMLFQAMQAFIRAKSQWDGTGCFHQTGVFDPSSGQWLSRAEDIGRHNCIDRIAGWSVAQDVPLSDKILFVSARVTASFCSKALQAGFKVIVSRSAVTTAAIALANKSGVSLVGFARTDEDRLTLFIDEKRRIEVIS